MQSRKLRDVLTRPLFACGFGLIACGCTTEFQYAGTNSTALPLVYTATVDGGSVASNQVGPSKDLPPTTVGKYKVGSKIGVEISLPQGGQVSETFNSLSKTPNPNILDVDVVAIPGVKVDFKNTADIEKTILDVAGSYRSPATLIGNFASGSFGGIYVVTDNIADTSNPDIRLVASPTELGSQVPESFFAPGTLPSHLSIALVLDRGAALQIAADIPATAALDLDFSKSAVYKYSMELKNTGWRVHPKSWNEISQNLAKTQDGKRILNNIRDELSRLKPGQHLYMLNRAYTVGTLDVQAYQGRSITGKAKIDASTYVTSMGAFQVNDTSSDRKSAANVVMRVKYEEISAIPKDTNALNSGGSASGHLNTQNMESKPASRTPERFPF